MNKTSRKRIGLLLPHSDTTLEYDLKRTLPNNISIHTERMWLDSVTIEAEIKMLMEEVPRGIKYLREVQPHISIFGCTSAGAIYGVKGDKRIKEEMKNSLNCLPITAFSAVIECLKDIYPKNLSIVTPYTHEVNMRVAEGLSKVGFNISFTTGLGYENDTDIGNTNPEEIIEFINKNKKNIESSDALFISCTNFRAFECKSFLETNLDINVVTSNFAIIKRINKILGEKIEV